jgi:hypothetical protein
MRTKILFIAALFSMSLFLTAQEKVLVVGFSEEYFRSTWRPIEMYAQRNKVESREVDDLFRKHLIENVLLNKAEFTFIKVADEDFSDLSRYKYYELKNRRNVTYIGFGQMVNSTELRALMEKYDADYLLHFSQYAIGVSFSMGLRTIHSIDYLVLNKEMETVSADKLMFTGAVARYMKPENMHRKYQRIGAKISKRLDTDLTNFYGKSAAKEIATVADSSAKPVLKVYNPRHALGISTGWGAPYGWGIEYSYLLTDKLDINLGTGFSFSGPRVGVGARYYFKNEWASPFVGANLVHTNGLYGYTVSVNGVSAQYKNFADQAFFLRGGYKLENYNRFHIFSIGYGFPFQNRGAQYISGSNHPSVKRFADAQPLGGLEISYTLIFRLGK